MTVHAEPTLPRHSTDPEKDYEAFLSRLGRKALASVEKHVEFCSGESALGYGRIWKRFACLLSRLAPHLIEATGQQTVKFYIPDGKYRVQVFTLQDSRKGIIQIFLPDIVSLALSRKLIKPGNSTTHIYDIPGDAGTHVELEPLNAETKDLPDCCRPMLGWGRRAIRTSVDVTADEKQIHAVERLCELAAEAFPEPLANPVSADLPRV